MIVHIVMDESKDVLKSYADMYRAFTDFDKAVEHAVSCGFQAMWLKPEPKVGTRHQFRQGATDVSILTVEVVE